MTQDLLIKFVEHKLSRCPGNVGLQQQLARLKAADTQQEPGALGKKTNTTPKE
jgi:hypothetical protein